MSNGSTDENKPHTDPALPGKPSVGGSPATSHLITPSSFFVPIFSALLAALISGCGVWLGLSGEVRELKGLVWNIDVKQINRAIGLMDITDPKQIGAMVRSSIDSEVPDQVKLHVRAEAPQIMREEASRQIDPLVGPAVAKEIDRQMPGAQGSPATSTMSKYIAEIARSEVRASVRTEFQPVIDDLLANSPIIKSMVTSTDRVKAQASQCPPAGTVILSASSEAPDGYLPADGRIVSRADYPMLFLAIGETWGKGDGKTTFAIPDLRGEFIRVLDTSGKIDPNRQLGKWQNSATAIPIAGFTTSEDGLHTHEMEAAGAHTHTMDPAGSHSHSFPRRAREPGGKGNCVTTSTNEFNEGPSPETDPAGSHTHVIRSAGSHTHVINPSGAHSHRVLGGDPETRPRNQALAAYIKF